MTHPIDLGALALSASLARGALSAVEVMTETLARIAARNARVNAIVSLADPDALMAQARAADAAPRRGWLHGIPMAVKDLTNVAGLPTSMGSPILAGQVAKTDDLIAARMRAAGALFIGKTNTPEFGLGSHTFNRVFGATRNPFDTSRSAGGSSGGAAVAMATGMVALADGSDMMGSLRNPAGWNNVYGMRPSYGRVPSDRGGESFLHPLATSGPMALNPADLAAFLDTLSGPVPGVPFCLPPERVQDRLDTDLRGARVGWLGDWGGAYPFEAGVLDTCRAALSVFADLGVEVEALQAPFPAADLWQSWLDLRAFANASRLAPLYANPAWRAELKDTAIWEIEQGRALTLQSVERASLARSGWYAKAADLFARYDALILPTAQVWPFAVDLPYPTEIAGRAMDTYHRWMEVVVPASLIGLPVVAVPAGFGTQGAGAGLPMGLQIIGAPGADLRVLQIAQGWHRAAPWVARRPSV